MKTKDIIFELWTTHLSICQCRGMLQSDLHNSKQQTEPVPRAVPPADHTYLI